MDDRDKSCAAGACAHDLYQCGIATAAYGRHPMLRGLNGIVHEIAVVIQHNVNPLKVFEKGLARLNPNVRDPLHDVLFADGSGLQLKDTSSLTGARETARRAAEYGPCLRGTNETVEAVAKHGVRIEPSGFSSAHNAGIAARAGCKGRLPTGVVAQNIKTSAATGAIFAGILGLYRASQRVSAGEATWSEVLPDVVREVGVAAASAGLGAAAGTMAAAMMPSGYAAIVVSFLVSLLVMSAASKGLNILMDEWLKQPQSALEVMPA